LKVVELVDEALHSQGIIHSNLNPEEIFMRNRSANSLCFVGLYSCLWDASKIL
jgi:serine/threonine protein kinase